MNSFDIIKLRAKKLKALADRGISGEKESAKHFLDEFMKKHNLTEKDIDDDKFVRLFKHRGLDYNTIVTNSIISVNPFLKILTENNAYKVLLDDADFLEAEYKTNYFYELLLKEVDALFTSFKRSNYGKRNADDYEMELFFTAFMTKHGKHFQPTEEAVLKHQPKQKPLSKKEAEALKKAQQEADKAFKEVQRQEQKKLKEKQAEDAKTKKDKNSQNKEDSQSENKKDKNFEDKSLDAPTQINSNDMQRIYAIMELMKDVKYVRVRNTLPIFVKKKENENSSRKYL